MKEGRKGWCCVGGRKTEESKKEQPSIEPNKETDIKEERKTLGSDRHTAREKEIVAPVMLVIMLITVTIMIMVTICSGN